MALLVEFACKVGNGVERLLRAQVNKDEVFSKRSQILGDWGSSQNHKFIYSGVPVCSFFNESPN